MDNDCETLDAEFFIAEIKKYPAIWKVGDEQYSDKAKKRSAWINICRHFCKNFDERDESFKNEISDRIIKRWRNIKDNYIKSLKRKAKSGKTTILSKQYVYARHLAFLTEANVINPTDIQANVAEEDEDEKSQDQVDKSTSNHKTKSRKRRRSVESPLMVMDYINNPIPHQAPQTSNADRSFFESLIPSLSDLTEDQKLEFRSEVLSTVQRIRKQRNVSTQANNSSQASSSNNTLHTTGVNYIPHSYALSSVPRTSFSNPGHYNSFPNSLKMSPSSSSTSSENIASIEDDFCIDIYKHSD